MLGFHCTWHLRKRTTLSVLGKNLFLIYFPNLPCPEQSMKVDILPNPVATSVTVLFDASTLHLASCCRLQWGLRRLLSPHLPTSFLIKLEAMHTANGQSEPGLATGIPVCKALFVWAGSSASLAHPSLFFLAVVPLVSTTLWPAVPSHFSDYFSSSFMSWHFYTLPWSFPSQQFCSLSSLHSLCWAQVTIPSALPLTDE